LVNEIEGGVDMGSFFSECGGLIVSSGCDEFQLFGHNLLVGSNSD
jgi:hypothetical protein